jgi:hypothetical protein
MTLSALWTRFLGNEYLVFTKLKEALQDEQSLENIPGRTAR